MTKNKIVKAVIRDYKERNEKLDALEQEFINSLIRLRKIHKATQQKLADDAGVIRETIARIENRITSPQINTLLKVLEPMGYTIKVTRIKNKTSN